VVPYVVFLFYFGSRFFNVYRNIWVPYGYLAMISAGEDFVFRSSQVLVLVRKGYSMMD
jgi:hypothetical protein